MPHFVKGVMNRHSSVWIFSFHKSRRFLGEDANNRRRRDETLDGQSIDAVCHDKSFHAEPLEDKHRLSQGPLEE